MTVARAHELRAEALTPRLRRDRRRSTISTSRAGRPDHDDRRGQRLRQVDAAARPRAAAAAAGRRGASSTATSVHDMQSVDVARVLGLLPQTPVAPDGITVGDLVGRGRYPHQGWFRRWSADDDAAVAAALEATGTADLVDRPRRRALGRPAPARLGRDGPRAGHRPAAARRADDLPRHQPPGRAARPAHRPQPAAGQDDRDRPARPQPRVPLRRPHHRDEGRRDPRRGSRRARSSTAAARDRAFRPRVRGRARPVSGTPMVVPRGRHHPDR